MVRRHRGRERRGARWLACLLIAASILQVGCAIPTRRHTADELARSVPVRELSARLGLEEGRSTETSCTLTDAHNVVTLYADPGGQAYLNGTALGPRGGFGTRGGVWYVPAALEGELRVALGVARESHAKTVEAREPATTPDPWRAPASRIGVVRPGRIVIDPGHGGKDPGAIAVNRLYEKEVNLDVAGMLSRELEISGHTVSMTRSTDRFVELDDRVLFSNSRRADLFVSIHADAAPNRSAQGFTVYVARQASRESVAAAEAIRRRLSATGAQDRGVRRADFRVLKKTRSPAVLVELGFLSNAEEARRLARVDYRRQLTDAIREGIDDYFRRFTTDDT